MGVNNAIAEKKNSNLRKPRVKACVQLFMDDGRRSAGVYVDGPENAIKTLLIAAAVQSKTFCMAMLNASMFIAESVENS